MIAVDSGVLTRALNRYVPEHARAAAVLESLVAGEIPWALPWPVVHTFVARVTHPHAVARPLGRIDAWGFVNLLLESPSVRPIGPGPRHAAVVREMLALLPAEAGTLPGLELAAVLREHGVRELLSTDRAMRVFPFLEVRDPLRGEPWTPGTPPLHRYRRLAGAARRG